jgi:hypothetical protein
MLYPPANIGSLFPTLKVAVSACGFESSALALLPGWPGAFDTSIETLLYK